MKSYQLLKLPLKIPDKCHQILKSLINQYQRVLTNPVITCYKVSSKNSSRTYCHYADESLSIHDSLKLMYDVSNGFVCSIWTAYQSHKPVIMFFYMSQDHHIYLLKQNLKDIYMPVQFNSTNEPEDWKTLKMAEVYLKYRNKFSHK